MNHLWIVTLKIIEAKQKLLVAKEMLVKGKKCFIFDLCKAEVRAKVHCVAHRVPNDTINNAFEGLGKVEEVARDMWRLPGLLHIESTTRIVRMSLKAHSDSSVFLRLTT